MPASTLAIEFHRMLSAKFAWRPAHSTTALLKTNPLRCTAYPPTQLPADAVAAAQFQISTRIVSQCHLAPSPQPCPRPPLAARPAYFPNHHHLMASRRRTSFQISEHTVSHCHLAPSPQPCPQPPLAAQPACPPNYQLITPDDA